MHRLIGLAFLSGTLVLRAQPSEPAAPLALPSPIREREAAIHAGLAWLESVQKPDGSWSDSRFPALTALPLWAFAQSDYPNREAIIRKAVAFLASCAREDGGIYQVLPGRGGGLSTYNTAICLAALHAVRDPALTPLLLRARRFLAAAQNLEEGPHYGGMGYDAASDRPYADLNNTVWAVEAMRRTESLEDLRPAGETRADMNWEAVRAYLRKVQNTREAGPDHEGGFFYRVDESKAGTETNAQGKVIFRSYGSMTYAGLLSLIYAAVDRQDPRVQSAFDWAVRHWTLDENPGMGAEGLYYFYHILTKALAAYGRPDIPPSGNRSTPIPWKEALTDRLLALQKPGPKPGQIYWVNETGRWQESDPVLVTSYTILALQMLR